MIDYPSLSSLLHYENFHYYVSSHSSINSGWDWEICLAKFEKEDIKAKFKKSNFIALSLDELTAIDNTSWICMHVYTICNFVCQPNLLMIVKMRDNSMAKNIFEVVKSSLIEYGGIYEMTIAQKLVCVGVDGALVMQGHKNGLVTKLKNFATDYILGIHYMAHGMNLAFGIVSNYPQIYRVEFLIKEIYSTFVEVLNDSRNFNSFLRA